LTEFQKKQQEDFNKMKDEWLKHTKENLKRKPQSEDT